MAEGSLPDCWVTSDEGYGQLVGFLDGVAVLGRIYMAEIPTNTRFWPTRPATVVPRNAAA